MNLSQVAIQLYTLRDFCKTPEETAATLRKVREIGYQAVQVSGVCKMPEEEFIKMLNAEGLVCCATHEDSKTILDAPEKVVERLRKLGCKHTAYPFPKEIDFSSRESVSALISKLDRAGAILREAGQVLSYHNHAIEFVKQEGRTILEQIYASTNARNLQAEIDTYWVQFGGGNPVEWCRQMKGRLPLLHAKDYGYTVENKPVFMEIGHGNLDFKAIVAAAEEAGMEWFIVEQDICPGDPFESIRKSFDYIKSHLVSDS
jgi:sugar phosphate isomerase/epimerase